jgi:hypothetical protein
MPPVAVTLLQAITKQARIPRDYGRDRRLAIAGETRRSRVGGIAVAGLRYHLTILAIPATSRSPRNCGLFLCFSVQQGATHSIDIRMLVGATLGTSGLSRKELPHAPNRYRDP